MEKEEMDILKSMQQNMNIMQETMKSMQETMKTMQGDIKAVQGDIKSIKITQVEHTQLLRALEHKTDVVGLKA